MSTPTKKDHTEDMLTEVMRDPTFARAAFEAACSEWADDVEEADAELARLRRRVATLTAAGHDLACSLSAFLVSARNRLGPEWASALAVLTRDLDAYNDAADGSRARVGEGTETR